jgi:hypothetical protein
VNESERNGAAFGNPHLVKDAISCNPIGNSTWSMELCKLPRYYLDHFPIDLLVPKLAELSKEWQSKCFSYIRSSRIAASLIEVLAKPSGSTYDTYRVKLIRWTKA